MMEKPYHGLAWHAPGKEPKKAAPPVRPEDEDYEPTYPDGSAVNECWRIPQVSGHSSAENLQEDETVL